MSGETPLHSPNRRRIEGRGTCEAEWLASATLDRMAALSVDDWATAFRRIWVLAPHPDDEVLALGGSLARLSAAAADVCIVSVTDGEASHADSTEWPPGRLSVVRPQEMLRGLDALDVRAEVLRLKLPDGRIGAYRQSLLQMLVEHVVESDLLLATCRFDGHPDHEACGDVAMLAAELTGAVVFEYPVWMWHWARPDEGLVPWNRAYRITIGDEALARKRHAIRQFESQTAPDGLREPVLAAHVLPRFLRPFEVVFGP